MDLTRLFCNVDDFVKALSDKNIEFIQCKSKRGISSRMSLSELMTIIIVNEVGKLLSFKVTKGNINDRSPVKELCRGLSGKLIDDKGYLSKKLFEELYEDGIQLITNVRSNMKNKLLKIEDKILLKKRFIIETINDQLKNISNIEHSRHRSPTNFMVNVVAGLISYSRQDKKPSITPNESSPN